MVNKWLNWWCMVGVWLNSLYTSLNCLYKPLIIAINNNTSIQYQAPERECKHWVQREKEQEREQEKKKKQF
jgi:hypothetical protein